MNLFLPINTTFTLILLESIHVLLIDGDLIRLLHSLYHLIDITLIDLIDTTLIDLIDTTLLLLTLTLLIEPMIIILVIVNYFNVIGSVLLPSEWIEDS